MSSFWQRVRGVFEQRAYTLHQFDPFLDKFVHVADPSGHVTRDDASGLAVAFACISAISQNLAAMPLRLYKRKPDDGREVANDHPLHGVLHDAFNGTLTAFLGREWLLANCLTSGNALAAVDRDKAGQVVALYPYREGSFSVELTKRGRLRYTITKPEGGTDVRLDGEVLHLRFRTTDGVVGLSPIQVCRKTFALAATQLTEAANQSQNSFRPAGTLTHPKRISPEAQRNLVQNFAKQYVGVGKANRPIFLQEGITFTPAQISNKDAEFIAARGMSNRDIMRIYACPPSVVGDPSESNYATAHQEAVAFMQRCLMPWARRIEQDMTMQLLSPEARKLLYVEHDLAGALRGSDEQRWAAYRDAVQLGVYTRNEVREFENMPKLDGLDEPLTPLNMGGADPASGNRGDQ